MIRKWLKLVHWIARAGAAVASRLSRFRRVVDELEKVAELLKQNGRYAPFDV